MVPSLNSSATPASPTTLPVGEILSSKPLGLTLRAVLLSLGLAVFFGYLIPIVDMKMRNTFLGATHLPPGAIAVLLILLLAINPLLKRMEANGKMAGVVALGTVVSAATAFATYRIWGIASLSFWRLGAATALLLVTLALFVFLR